MGDFKTAQFFLDGIGKGSFFVSEQLTLDQRLRNSCAVDGDKGMIFPGTMVVDGPGDELFACSALPHDQDRLPGLSHLLHQFKYFFHPLALSHNIIKAKIPVHFHP